MDRTHSVFKASHPPITSSDFRVDSGVFSRSTHDTDFTLFAPMHYEPGYAYPLIVWLHGQGSNERQLTRVMPLVSMRNYVAVAPRGVAIEDSDVSSGMCCTWRQSRQAVELAEQYIYDGMETAARKLHVNRRRIFLAGFDCGGTMAFRVAFSQPNRFAGVLSLCGPFPQGRTPLGNLLAARRLPVFLATGRDSRQYPTSQVCENLRLLHTAGLSITLRQYPCGHELAPQMLPDMDRWIIEQITSPSFLD